MTRRAHVPGDPNHPHRRPAASPSNGRPDLRSLPSVDELARAAKLSAVGEFGTDVTFEMWVEAARAAVREARETTLGGGPIAAHDELVLGVQRRVRAMRTGSLRPVINATGVIINTNLGRVPLCDAALDAMEAVARGYSNLEFDLDEGARGSRHTHTRALVRELTGAEDALVVNNNAAAVLVVLSALAADRDVIVSRGELIEIGGGFRVPDVMRQSGARLVEVGTTNRTHLRDFEMAITVQTALLLAVHPSNFRVVGFTETPELTALAALAHQHGHPLLHDIGSGALLATERWGLAHEPAVQESVRAGADIVCFSGDKLLGGPQAGIIAGRAGLLQEIARHPLMRAVRIDKLTLVALEATLRQYRSGAAEQTVPVWRAISMPLEEVSKRAHHWAALMRDWGVVAEAVPGESTVGGGSLPGETLPTVVCAIHPHSDARYLDLEALAGRLRTGEPPVVGRIWRDQLLLDPRTVRTDEDEQLLAAVQMAISA